MEEGTNFQSSQDSFLDNAFEAGQEVLSSYGWFIAFSLILLYGLWLKFESHWSTWKKQREERQNTNVFYNDPDSVVERQEAMLAARQRLQEQYAASAAQHAEKVKAKEEEKRQEKIREWEKLQQGKGFHSKHRVVDDSSTSTSHRTGTKSETLASKNKGPSLRPEYNPLMGHGGGTCYRPPRRGGARGG